MNASTPSERFHTSPKGLNIGLSILAFTVLLAGCPNPASETWNGSITGLMPTDGNSLASSGLELSWNQISGTAVYQLQISESRAALENAQIIEVAGTSWNPNLQNDNVMYYWRIRAVQSGGGPGPWSSINSFTMKWGVISGMFPSDRAETSLVLPTFSWNSVADAVKYELQIADEVPKLSNADTATSLTPIYTPEVPLKNNTVYYWRVRAVNENDQSGAWTQPLQLIISQIHGLNPANGIVVEDTTPLFSWDAVEGASGYRIRIADNPTALDGTNAFDVTDTSFSFSDSEEKNSLANGQAHYWQVHALRTIQPAEDTATGTETDATEEVTEEEARTEIIASSAIYILTVNWGEISGMNPPSGTETSNLTPVLSWHAVMGASHYDVQIATSLADMEFSDLWEVPASIYEIDDSLELENNQTHYWRVRAVDEAGESGPWSIIQTLIGIWGLVDGLTPADAALIADPDTVLNWHSVSDARSYEIQIVKSSDEPADVYSLFADAITFPSEITSYRLSDVLALADGDWIYWRIRALNDNGQMGKWTEPSMLRFDSNAIAGIGPVGLIFNDSPALTWNKVTGAAKYQVQIADSSTAFETAPLIDVASAPYPLATVDLTNGDKDFWWRVLALDANGNSIAWSAPTTFSVSKGSIEGMSPTNGAVTFNQGPLLNWDIRDGAASYQVRMADTEAELNGASKKSVTDSEYKPGSVLTFGNQYWQVRALDSYDGSPGVWSTPANFHVADSSISNMRPSEGAISFDATPPLTWSAVSGAAYYKLAIDSSESALTDGSAYVHNVFKNEYIPNTGLSGKQYWHVQAVDDEGYTSEWSQILSFTVSNQALTGLSPAAGTITFNDTPLLGWTPINGASQYDVRLAISEPALSSAVIKKTAATDTSYRPTVKLTGDGQEHYWQVRAVDEYGQTSPWSVAGNFIVESGIIDEAQINLADSITILDVSPVIDWADVAGAAKYQVWVALSKADLSSINTVEIADESTDSQFSPGLNSGQTYYWKVRAVDSKDQAAPWTNPRSLTVSEGIISGMSPGNGSIAFDQNVTMQWDMEAGVTYQVQIAATETELDNAVSADASANSYTSIRGIGTHWWRVRAVKNGVAGDWGSAYSFRIASGLISGLFPVSQSISYDSTPVLSWNSTEGADSYDVRVATSSAALNTAKIYTEDDTSYIPDTPYAAGQVLYWQVRAVDFNGYKTAWSTETVLNISSGTIDNLSPDGTTLFTDSPLLNWSDVNGAARYELRLADTVPNLQSAILEEVTDSEYRASALGSGTHYWQVRARDSVFNEPAAWSGTKSFTIDQGSISAMEPGNGDITYDTTPALSWDSVNGAAEYELQIIETTDSFGTSVLSAASSNYVSAQLAVGNYQWRVRAVDAWNNQAPWGTASGFEIGLGEISNLAPPSLSITFNTSPRFSWDAVNGAITYEVRFATSSALLSTATIYSTYNQFYVPATGFSRGSTIHWQVRAVDRAGFKAGWSPPIILELGNGSITNMTPSGLTLFNDKPTLDWDDVNGVSKYELRIADTSAGLEGSEQDVQTSEYTPANALAVGDHYWQVRAVDNVYGEPAPWSEIKTFTVSQGSIGGMKPDDGDFSFNTTPTLSWNAVAQAAKYQLQISALTTSLDSTGIQDTYFPNYAVSTPLQNGQYHWRVRVLSGDGTAGIWSTPYSFEISSGAVTGMSPASLTVTYDTTPTLSWNTVHGADRFNIRIATSSNGLSAATLNTATGLSFTPNAPFASGQTLHWQVRAVDSGGFADAWSSEQTLVLNSGMIVNTSPGHTATLFSLRPTLNWDDVEGVSKYELRLADNQNDLAASTVEVTVSNFTPVAALTFAAYYWQVRAVDTVYNEPGPWNTVHSFTISQGSIVGMSPADGSTSFDTTPTLSWNAVGQAAKYQLQVSTDLANLESASILESSAANYTHSTLTNATHHWRVRAVDEDGNSAEWSQTYSFIVNNSSPGNLSPTSGTVTFNDTPLMSWSAVSGTKAYEVKMATSEPGLSSALSKNADADTASYRPTTKLTGNGQIHYWKVRALDDYGQATPWSNTGNFTVASGLIDEGSFSHPNGTTILEGHPTLDWDDVTGAAKYQIWMALNQADLASAATVAIQEESATSEFSPNLNSGETYYWKVRAVDSFNQAAPWTSPISLAVSQGAISGMSPGNGLIGFNSEVTMRWDAVSGVSSYQLRIASTQAGLSGVNPIDVNGNSYTSTLGTGTHWWQVQAVNSGTAGQWGPSYSFVISSGASGGLDPVSGSVIYNNSPVLSWNSVTGAVRYDVRIASSLAAMGAAMPNSEVDTTYMPDAPFAISTLYWQIRAVDANGFEAAWSTVNELEISRGTITGMTPEGDTLFNAKPTLNWDNVNSAAKYEVRLATTENGLNTAAESEIPTSEYTPVSSLPTGVHYWQVRALDGNNAAAPWSSSKSFTVSEGKASGLSPNDGKKTFDATPTLSWNAVTGAVSYKLQIVPVADSFGTLTLNSTSPSYTTAQLADGQYKWRVRAVDGNGDEGIWVTEINLLVSLGEVSGLNPADQSTSFDTTPTLSWNAVDGAEKYEVRYATSPGNLSAAYIYTVNTNTYAPTTGLTRGETIHWQVRAVDESEFRAGWSPDRSLQVSEGTITNMSPDNVTLFNRTPLFDWDDVSGASSYELRLATSAANLGTAAAILNLQNSDYTPSAALSYDTHYWQVRAMDSINEPAPWSTAKSFTVSQGVISGMKPANGDITFDTNPTLSWDAVATAGKYEVQIAAASVSLDSAQTLLSYFASYSVPTSLQNGNYHWRVRAVDSTGTPGQWGAANILEISPGTVNGLLPAKQTVTFDTSPRLSWTTVHGAVSYDVRIATTSAALSAAAANNTLSTSFVPGSSYAAGQTLYWQARAVDKVGYTDSWSAESTLVLDAGTIENMVPNSSTLFNNKPTLSWNPVNAASQYEIRIAASIPALSTASASLVSNPNHIPGIAQAIGAKYWQVRAFDIVYNEPAPWSDIKSYTLSEGKVGNTNRMPSDAASIFSGTPTLSWTAIAHASEYRVRIAASTSGLSSASSVTATATSLNAFASSALGNGATRYWQVQALDVNGDAGTWSDAYSLSKIEGNVGSTAPADGKITFNRRRNLSWSSTTGASRYELQMAREGTAISSVTPVSLTGTDYTPDSDLAFVNYNWRIRAVDELGDKGPWTSETLLTVENGALTGLSAAPVDMNNETIDTTPSFNWNAANGAVKYRLQIADNAAWTAASLDMNTSSLSHTLLSALANDKLYYWRVKAIDSDDFEAALWNTGPSIKVAWGRGIDNMSPIEGARFISGQPEFRWDEAEKLNGVNETVNYELQIAASQSGLDSAALHNTTNLNYEPSTAISTTGTHYWRVRGVKANGVKGVWSPVSAFTIYTHPPQGDGFILIEGGTFTMGGPDGEMLSSGWFDSQDEMPQHQVSVSSFYMSSHEVTQQEWEDVMGNNPSGTVGASLPVTNVSWLDAVNYCNSLSDNAGLTRVYTVVNTNVTADWTADGYRLPTEAEWEYAARAGTNRARYYSDLEAIVWYADSILKDVGGRKANAFGLYDMLGNVSEWCWDWFAADYYSTAAATNPRGPAGGSDKVTRGGSNQSYVFAGVSIDLYLDILRSASRMFERDPGVSDNSLGFRVARNY